MRRGPTSTWRSTAPEVARVLTDMQLAGTKLSTADLSKALQEFGTKAQKAGARFTASLTGRSPRCSLGARDCQRAGSAMPSEPWVTYAAWSACCGGYKVSIPMQSTAIPQGIRIDAMATRVPRPSPDAPFMTSLRWFRGSSLRIGPAERVGSHHARAGKRVLPDSSPRWCGRRSPPRDAPAACRPRCCARCCRGSPIVTPSLGRSQKSRPSERAIALIFHRAAPGRC